MRSLHSQFFTLHSNNSAPALSLDKTGALRYNYINKRRPSGQGRSFPEPRYLGKRRSYFKGRLLFSVLEAQADDGTDQDAELNQIRVCNHINTSLRGRNSLYTPFIDTLSISYITILCQSTAFSGGFCLICRHYN